MPAEVWYLLLLCAANGHPNVCTEATRKAAPYEVTCDLFPDYQKKTLSKLGACVEPAKP